MNQAKPLTPSDVRVLVVDDEGRLRDVLTRAIASWGFQVAGARSGEEALRLMQASKFDISILDLNLPRRDGGEVLRLVRSVGDEHPVLVLTARQEMEVKVRCLDAGASSAMVKEIDALRKANESLGGVFEVQAFGLLPGLGSHVSWEERLDGRLAMAILSVQALKGVCIGEAFQIAGVPGSQAHDEIFFSDERGYFRETNRAGGLEGGMTTGEPLIVRGAMKPLPTLTKPLRSVDIATRQPAEALRERTDSCTVPAAAVVGEAMVALVLADAYRRKFGGDHIDDVRQAVRAYEERIGWRR